MAEKEKEKLKPLDIATNKRSQRRSAVSILFYFELPMRAQSPSNKSLERYAAADQRKNAPDRRRIRSLSGSDFENKSIEI